MYCIVLLRSEKTPHFLIVLTVSVLLPCAVKGHEKKGYNDKADKKKNTIGHEENSLKTQVRYSGLLCIHMTILNYFSKCLILVILENLIYLCYVMLNEIL